MYLVSDSVSLFGATTTSLGSVILYVLGVVVAAWAGFLILRWALGRVRYLMGWYRVSRGRDPFV